MLPAIEDFPNGELISIPSFLFASANPLAGDERKKSGEDDATFCRNARGVACKLACGDVEVNSWFGGRACLEIVVGVPPGT